MFGQVKNVEDLLCKHKVFPAFDLWYHVIIMDCKSQLTQRGKKKKKPDFC
jgi:hypothetical protein